MTPAERRILLGALGFLSFGAVYAHVVMTPVLTQLAREFGTTTGTAGIVVAAYGLPGIVTGLVAGPFSDRMGRKPFLVGGSLVMALFTAMSAVAPSFEVLLVTRVIAGIGASLIFPNVNATIADSFPYGERGKAISTVMGLNTMASIVGIPLAGIIAELTSWRLSLLLVGALALAATLAVFLFIPRSRPEGDPRRTRALFGSVLASRSAIAAIVSSLMGALFWFTWVTYSVVYFEEVHSLTPSTAATVALTLGLGVLVGSQIGGRLGDRLGHRRIVWSTIAISSVLLLALTNLPLPLAAAGVLNFVTSCVIGARFATNTALLGEQVPEARGTMLAVASSVISVGVVLGAYIGGVLIDGPGFPALGVVCAVVGLVSAAIVLLFVREEPMDLEGQVV
ncbi:MAG TPA: MFS transporter [Candidatus Limnocylindria bacterium]|nr:MFS transporter [Candidatus Limnocylindria bacterium]